MHHLRHSRRPDRSLRPASPTPSAHYGLSYNLLRLDERLRTNGPPPGVATPQTSPSENPAADEPAFRRTSTPSNRPSARLRRVAIIAAARSWGRGSASPHGIGRHW